VKDTQYYLRVLHAAHRGIEEMQHEIEKHRLNLSRVAGSSEEDLVVLIGSAILLLRSDVGDLYEMVSQLRKGRGVSCEG
jgi:hypothetical protein